MNPLIETLVTDSSEKIRQEYVELVESLFEATPEQWAGENNPADWEVDPEGMNKAMGDIGTHLKHRARTGFTGRTGRAIPPMSSDQADAMWKEREPRFREVASQFDPQLSRKLQTHRQKTPRAVCPHCGK